jgi:hypothetical protein
MTKTHTLIEKNIHINAPIDCLPKGTGDVTVPQYFRQVFLFANHNYIFETVKSKCIEDTYLPIQPPTIPSKIQIQNELLVTHTDTRVRILFADHPKLTRKGIACD